MANVLLISDEAIPRAGLRNLLVSESGIKVVGEASARDAVRQAERLKPQVIVFHAPGLASAELIGSLSKAAPESSLIVLGREAETGYLGLLLASGTRGYVLLRSAPRELFRAIYAVLSGQRFIDASLSEQMYELLAREAVGGTKELSRREEQVLRLLAYGFTLKEISARLKISRKSVETYQMRIREKLGLRTRSEIVRYALAAGLLTSDASRTA